VTAVSGNQRFSKANPCPVCSGYQGADRGSAKRCHGYRSTDGLYIHCAREEYAGDISQHDTSGLYPHKRQGACACGVTHLAAEPSSSRSIEATYDYRDEQGALLFQVVRFVGKDFRQRRPDNADPSGWNWKLGETRRVLYNLPALLAADPAELVLIVEGEKDADNLNRAGFLATTNPGGAKKWNTWAGVDASARLALSGRRVCLIPDTDDAGRAHADQVAAAVSDYASEVRVLWLPDVKDVSEWLGRGGSVDHLRHAASTAPLFRSYEDVAADRDAEPTPLKRIGRTWMECVDEVYQRADEPWVEIRIKETVIATCRNGSFIPLVAPSGSGKSTLALQMLIDHALHFGPAIYLTYELDGDEAVASRGRSALLVRLGERARGEVPRAEIPDVKRIRVLERDDATLTNLRSVSSSEMRAEFRKDQPVFVVVDYLQATPAPPGKERGHTANVSVELGEQRRRTASFSSASAQASTDNSKKLRAGDLLGIESAPRPVRRPRRSSAMPT
jgi:hypothetical protein